MSNIPRRRLRVAGHRSRDLPETEAEESQRGDFFEAPEIAQGIETVPRACSARLQQSQSIIVVQRLDRHAGQLRKLVNAVQLAQDGSLDDVRV
jgi:hypothetical protein